MIMMNILPFIVEKDLSSIKYVTLACSMITLAKAYETGMHLLSLRPVRLILFLGVIATDRACLCQSSL